MRFRAKYEGCVRPGLHAALGMRVAAEVLLVFSMAAHRFAASCAFLGSSSEVDDFETDVA